MYKIGIDIGGTKVSIGLLDENNTLVQNEKLYIKDIDDITVSIKNVIDKMCNTLNISCSDIVSCGIGVPGTVSDDGKRLIKAPNISIISEDIANKISEALNLPTALVQDSRAAAWGEYLCGGGKGANSVVCITVGTGIGTGIVLDGKIYAGALGSAGEMGHIPVVENGRKCGCGKTGCLEKYCAGGGLDITAEELLGKGKNASDLFNAALCGDENALAEIQKAIQMLGRVVVSVINLLSPDCILFSGGLSEQEEMYINPVIDYVKSHCYTSGRIPVLKKAELGGNAPMIGAALIPIEKKRQPMLSASVMCANVLNFGEALDEIKAAGIQYIHCDVMDNHFVPNLMLPMELLNTLHEHTNIPFDYHIMAENPISIIEKLTIKQGDIISVHYESTNHLQLAISKIKEMGAKAAVAINPSTPINVLSEVLDEIDMVLLMTVNPGFAGQKIVPSAFDKIKNMRKMLNALGYTDILIQVDGNCSFENVPKMYNAGADIFVVGTSSVFKQGLSIEEGTKMLYDSLKGDN